MLKVSWKNNIRCGWLGRVRHHVFKNPLGLFSKRSRVPDELGPWTFVFGLQPGTRTSYLEATHHSQPDDHHLELTSSPIMTMPFPASSQHPFHVAAGLFCETHNTTPVLNFVPTTRQSSKPSSCLRRQVPRAHPRRLLTLGRCSCVMAVYPRNQPLAPALLNPCIARNPWAAS